MKCKHLKIQQANVFLFIQSVYSSHLTKYKSWLIFFLSLLVVHIEWGMEEDERAAHTIMMRSRGRLRLNGMNWLLKEMKLNWGHRCRWSLLLVGGWWWDNSRVFSLEFIMIDWYRARQQFDRLFIVVCHLRKHFIDWRGCIALRNNKGVTEISIW